MPRIEEYSLIRYDSKQGLPGQHAAGCTRPAPRQASAPGHPYAKSITPFVTAHPSGLNRTLVIYAYSQRRTLATSAAAATGQVVDIFV
jgi:hypothetical protein